jgi:hypothetical protein
MPTPVDLGVINDVLKVLSRQYGIERDRKAVLQIATLLLRLWNEGVRSREDLRERAATALGETAFGSNPAQAWAHFRRMGCSKPWTAYWEALTRLVFDQPVRSLPANTRAPGWRGRNAEWLIMSLQKVLLCSVGVDLSLRHSLVGSDVPTTHLCFLESGLASMVAISSDDEAIETGHIGRDGASGLHLKVYYMPSTRPVECAGAGEETLIEIAGGCRGVPGRHYRKLLAFRAASN